MPPKKTNGFMEFVMDWKDKNAPALSLPEAIERVDPIWKKLPDEKKQYYKEKAKGCPKIPGKKAVKLTCDGTPIDVVEKQEREKEEQRKRMIVHIRKIVGNALNNGQILSEKFYFIMVNHYMRIIHTEDYVPAEIALIEFSLNDGVKRKYHTYVNPKVDFYGNLYEVKQHAEDTHQLPLPPETLPCQESEVIFREILNFIYDKKRDVYPPLYTFEKQMYVVNSCLEFLMGEEEASKSNLDIYSIQHLFHNLKCSASEFAGTTEKPNYYITSVVLDRDAFEYTNGIACDYHEEIDRSNYCALSQVIRWGFTFVDYVGKDLNLDLKPGIHLPGTYDAKMIMSSSQNNTDNSSMQSLIDTVSELSLTSNSNTSEEYMSAKSQPSTAKSKFEPNLRNPIYENLSHNAWSRHDTSQPPDSRLFTVDEPEKPTSSRGARFSGRGIAIFDHDMYPSLGEKKSNGRGRSLN